MNTKRSLLLVSVIVIVGALVGFRYNAGKQILHGISEKPTSPVSVVSPDSEKSTSSEYSGYPVPPDFMAVSSPDVGKDTSSRGLPVVAIVIDDFGYSLKLAEALSRLAIPTTWTIIPDTAYGLRIARMAEDHNIPFLIHVPMQAISDVERSKYLIGDGMTYSEIRTEINRLAGLFPNAYGISNHRGSKATSDPNIMDAVMDELSGRKLIFLDSRTSVRSVAYDEALKKGIPAIYNSIFLDHVDSPDFMAEQFFRAKKIARRRGWVVVICHVRPGTLTFLSKLCIKSDNDVEFFTVPELLKKLPEPKEVS